MKSKIKLLLILSVCFNLRPAICQNSNNFNILDTNSIESPGSYSIKKLRLDSIIGARGENKFIYRWSYENNQITEELFKIVGGITNPMAKRVRIYNDRDLLKVEFRYTWKDELNIYQPNTAMNGSKTEFIYDDNRNILFEYQYFWNTDKESYLPYDKKANEYDSKGNKILRFWYTWNSKSEKFNFNSKTENTYNQISNIIESKYYDHHYQDGFFLEKRYTHTYSELLDSQHMNVYELNDESKKMEISYSIDTRYSFMENKKFSINTHAWDGEILKNKLIKKRVIHPPKFIRIIENDISDARFDPNHEWKYDRYGICILRNTFSTNKVTNNRYKSNIRAREIIVDDENKLIYRYTDSDYDLDFYNWEMDREWLEYYSKVK